jgi:hypothetical protein
MAESKAFMFLFAVVGVRGEEKGRLLFCPAGLGETSAEGASDWEGVPDADVTADWD